MNTRSLEVGTDDIGTPSALAAWLRRRKLISPRAAVSDTDLRKATTVREGLRALIAPQHQDAKQTEIGADSSADDGAPLSALAALAADLPLVLDMAADPPRLCPAAGRPVDDAPAQILAAVRAAVPAGTWNRMKVCRQPNCRWASYDESRNRSRAWCAMETCGNRAKARSFRLRHGCPRGASARPSYRVTVRR